MFGFWVSGFGIWFYRFKAEGLKIWVKVFGLTVLG